MSTALWVGIGQVQICPGQLSRRISSGTHGCDEAVTVFQLPESYIKLNNNHAQILFKKYCARVCKSTSRSGIFLCIISGGEETGTIISNNFPQYLLHNLYNVNIFDCTSELLLCFSGSSKVFNAIDIYLNKSAVWGMKKKKIFQTWPCRQ